MKAVRFYIPRDYLDRYIKSKLSEEDRAALEDCEFAPSVVKVEDDFSVDITAVPVKSGEQIRCDGQNCRRYILDIDEIQ